MVVLIRLVISFGLREKNQEQKKTATRSQHSPSDQSSLHVIDRTVYRAATFDYAVSVHDFIIYNLAEKTESDTLL